MPCYSAFDFSMESLNTETTREPGAQSTLLRVLGASNRSRATDSSSCRYQKCPYRQNERDLYVCLATSVPLQRRSPSFCRL